jgi:hypothetical protein
MLTGCFFLGHEGLAHMELLSRKKLLLISKIKSKIGNDATVPVLKLAGLTSSNDDTVVISIFSYL